MSLTLYLIRHGNTFHANEVPRWVGRHENPPLTPTGEAQALALKEILPPIDAWYCSQLQRTHRTAILLGETPIATPHLNEIDYGAWGDKTTPEINAMGDGDALAAWEKNGIFPPQWPEQEHDVLARVRIFCDALPTTGTIGVVSSNGVLRYFQDVLLGNQLQARKLRTGDYGILEKTDAGWQCLRWGAESFAHAAIIGTS